MRQSQALLKGLILLLHCCLFGQPLISLNNSARTSPPQRAAVTSATATPLPEDFNLRQDQLQIPRATLKTPEMPQFSLRRRKIVFSLPC